MMDFSKNNVFKLMEESLQVKGITDISFENTNNDDVKTLCVGYARVGEVKVKHENYNDETCCNVRVAFDFYVKEDEEKYEYFIDKFIGLCKSLQQ